MQTYTFIIHWRDGSKTVGQEKGTDEHKALVAYFHTVGYWGQCGASPTAKMINYVEVQTQ